MFHHLGLVSTATDAAAAATATAAAAATTAATAAAGRGWSSRRGGLRKGLGGIENGAISSAAAEISIHVFLDEVRICLGVVAEERVESHDDARSTEATLTPVHSRYALLNWMQTLLYVTNAFHGHDVGPVQSTERQQASIQTDVPWCR